MTGKSSVMFDRREQFAALHTHSIANALSGGSLRFWSACLPFQLVLSEPTRRRLGTAARTRYICWNGRRYRNGRCANCTTVLMGRIRPTCTENYGGQFLRRVCLTRTDERVDSPTKSQICDADIIVQQTDNLNLHRRNIRRTKAIIVGAPGRIAASCACDIVQCNDEYS